MTTLEFGEVHIWTARFEGQLNVAAFERVLSPFERTAANRFYFERHRLNYRFAHTMLRNVLSFYTAQAPEVIRFEPNRFGKPFLLGDGPEGQMHFNMSHSGDVVMIGVTRGRHIGVDVELLRSLNDFASIAKLNFTPAERAFIESFPQEFQQEAFFKCWTRKEALIKAVGM